MKCRRVEKLIPLYVADDLASGVADRITSHIEWCGRCNWLADEYKESRAWIRSSEPPDFETASLNELKAGVMRRIAETNAQPSLLSSLRQQWGRRQVLALSTAMLIIFGVVVFYLYQTRMSVIPQPVEAIKQPPVSPNPPVNKPPRTPDTVAATVAGFTKPHHANRNARFRARGGTANKTGQAVEPNLFARATRPVESGAPLPERADNIPGDVNDSPGTLRIEIQTSDPNIRIIWFAPREVESPKTD